MCSSDLQPSAAPTPPARIRRVRDPLELAEHRAGNEQHPTQESRANEVEHPPVDERARVDDVDLAAPDIDTVLLRVKDNGIGIPRADLKRIFKRFYRVSSRSTDQVKGTGLGLFIVRSIVRRHGGEIIAESSGEGLGSVFTVRLPRIYRV